jgi:hypothetical protein
VLLIERDHEIQAFAARAANQFFAEKHSPAVIIGTAFLTP